MAKGIDAVASELAKKYDIFIGHLGDNEVAQVPYIPTGLLQLDLAIGIGGIPLGYFVEVYSPEGVGKTTLCLQLIAQAQRHGLETAYIDMEHRIDPVWAETLGVDLDRMYFTQPPYGEAALNVCHALIKGGVRLVVIDSVPSLVPKAEWEGVTGDQFVGLLARILSQNLRQMVHSMKANDATVIFVNQIRSKIGGMGSLAMGPQQTQPGGWALRHNASLRIDMRRIKTLTTSGGDPTGQIVRVTIKKNSLATPFRSADLRLNFGVGFDKVESVIDAGISLGLISQSGSWFEVDGEKFHGRTNLYEYISKDEVLSAMYDKAKGILTSGNKDDVPDGEDS